jgi:hypothetical protein
MSPDCTNTSSTPAILDFELIDVAGLAHLHETLGHRLFERERHFARRRFAVNEIDRKVFMYHRPRNARRVRCLRAGEAGERKQHQRRNRNSGKQ